MLVQAQKESTPIKKANSYTGAIQAAKSIIYVRVIFSNPAASVIIVVPTAMLTSTYQIFVNGSYYDASNNWHAKAELSTSAATVSGYKAGVQDNNITVEYYYA